MKLCVDCIHVGVCYRQGTVDLNYADKCGDYMPGKVIEDIKHDIENQLFVGRLTNPYEFDEGLKWCLEIIDKHISGDMRGDTE